MAYTPINWDELTPINIANLNKMDGEIDSNESRVTTAESEIDSNESRVTTAESELDDIDSNGDGRVNSADYAVNADNVTSTYKGNDIDTDGDGKVDNADNADNVTSTYKGNDLDTNGDGIVDNADNALRADDADNALRLNSKSWVTIASGSVGTGNTRVDLKSVPLIGQQHYHYIFSVYSTETYINYSSDIAIIRNTSGYDELDIENSAGTAYYEVWSWE